MGELRFVVQVLVSQVFTNHELKMNEIGSTKRERRAKGGKGRERQRRERVLATQSPFVDCKRFAAFSFSSSKSKKKNDKEVKEKTKGKE